MINRHVLVLGLLLGCSPMLWLSAQEGSVMSKESGSTVARERAEGQSDIDILLNDKSLQTVSMADEVYIYGASETETPYTEAQRDSLLARAETAPAAPSPTAQASNDTIFIDELDDDSPAQEQLRMEPAQVKTSSSSSRSRLYVRPLARNERGMSARNARRSKGSKGWKAHRNYKPKKTGCRF